MRWFLSALGMCCFAALSLPCKAGQAQASPGPTTSDASVPTLHVSTSLTLVDVIAEQPQNKLHTRKLLTALKPTDFRLFDNGHEVSIRNVDIGAENIVRPIALWLVVQCNMGFPIGWSSAFIRGKTDLLKPALDALNRQDVIGVAHWCDDGEAKIDRPASPNGVKSLAAVETVLHEPVHNGQDRLGEIALQRLINLVIGSTAAMTPRRLPVFLFLYGDHSATYVSEAHEIIRSLLESSGVVFGLNDAANEISQEQNLGAAGQVSHLIHYYAAATGGQFYSTADVNMLAPTLAYLLTQVHLRYVLSFEPLQRDGKRHTLRVELTKDARKAYLNPDLRYRTEYIPLPPQADGQIPRMDKAPPRLGPAL